jgi:hypothetical protein
MIKYSSSISLILETYHLFGNVRAAIGSFNNKWLLIFSVLHLNSLLNRCILLILIINLSILILLSGTVHPNPGPSEFCMSVARLNARSLILLFCINLTCSLFWRRG